MGAARLDFRQDGDDEQTPDTFAPTGGVDEEIVYDPCWTAQGHVVMTFHFSIDVAEQYAALFGDKKHCVWIAYLPFQKTGIIRWRSSGCFNEALRVKLVMKCYKKRSKRPQNLDVQRRRGSNDEII